MHIKDINDLPDEVLDRIEIMYDRSLEILFENDSKNKVAEAYIVAQMILIGILSYAKIETPHGEQPVDVDILVNNLAESIRMNVKKQRDDKFFSF